MEAPVNETPSIKAPRSLVIIHTVWLEIGLVILVSLWGSYKGHAGIIAGLSLALVFITLWVLTWLLRRTNLAKVAIRVSIFVALLCLPLGIIGIIALIIELANQYASLRQIPEESRRIIAAQRFAKNVSYYIDANLILMCLGTAVLVFALAYQGLLWKSSDWPTAIGISMFCLVALIMSAVALSYRGRNLREAWSDVVYANSMKYSLTSVMFIVAGLAVFFIHNNNMRG
jgi:hypothetical protein